MKKISLIAIIVAVVMLLSAFAGVAEGWDTGKTDEIVVSVINGFYTAGEKKLAEDYMKLHPETKVTIDVIADNNSYTTKMQTVAADVNRAGSSDIVHANFYADVVGGTAAAVAQGYLMNMETLLDLDHPYQDGKVRDMFEENVLAEARNNAGGNGMIALPFDKCGISFYYNKDAFEAQGLSAPATWEDLLAACETFKANGVETPITVSSESNWIMASLADAAYRYDEYTYLVQPGDSDWNEDTMQANVDFVFDDADMSCDQFTVKSNERIMAARRDGIILSETSKVCWTEFAKLAQYFPYNFIAGGADSVTEFEMQYSPMLLTGSWNVGLLIDDLNQMPEEARFEWATFNIPGFANPPEGFGSEMRGLYVMGNQMGIIPKEDEDHNARVLDFYLYWYSQAGAQLCYEETLSNGNYVQGPAMIKGVELSPELNEKLEGFIVEGAVKDYFSILIGMNQTTEADRPAHNDLMNKFIAGEIDVDAWLTGMNEIVQTFNNEQMENAGYDGDPTT